MKVFLIIVLSGLLSFLLVTGWCIYLQGKISCFKIDKWINLIGLPLLVASTFYFCFKFLY